ncbi:hypothetical protein HPO96_31905 [Kribbella sandramycini]|uniref:Secreted protein n=1 Tax=Kribbella sandramycini TaxID=60450 RepID=A0A7Y4L828_9ACTN|nr:DUF5719 family protein [Kribbella sandramycini]MBB6567149.1 hypothetical protein [Kribbella sandramycini]NOL44866.1 hypothetical protein [Kribbella sandramycini]
MSGLLSDPRARLGICVLAIAAVGGLAVVTQPKKPDVSPTAAAQSPARSVVNRAALACPALTAGKQTAVVNAVAPTLPEGTPTAAGEEQPLSITPLGKDPAPVGSVLVRNKIAATTPSAQPKTLSIVGTGPLAAGTVGTSTATATTGANQGMASAPCQAPGSDFWFVGASTANDRRDVLTLTNLDSVNAAVNVTIFSNKGQLELPATRGIVVAAHSTTEVFLGQFARSQKDLALHVESTGGRVAPALRSNAAKADKSPGGVDWIGPSAAPANKVFVPAVAPGAGARTLIVANPTDLQATIGVTVNGPNGPFKPAGQESVRLPAGAVVAIPLQVVLKGDASAISLTSDQPITASVRMVDKSGEDFASTGSSDPLRGPGYVVLPPHAQPATLQLTALEKPASLKLELRDASGKVLQTRTVDVSGGTTVPIQLKAQTKPTYLTVEQTRGSLIAGVTLTPPAKADSDAVAQMAAWPLNTSLVFRAQLGAQPDVRAALGN